MPGNNILNNSSIEQRIDALNNESWTTRNTNTERALEMAHEACDKSAKLNYDTGLAYSLRNLAICNQLLANYDLSLKYCFEALPFFEILNEQKGMATVYSCIGTDFFLMSDYENSLSYHLKALKIREEIKSPPDQSSSLLNIASVYASIKDYDNALNYYSRSEQLARGLNDKNIWARVLNGIGGTYMVRGDYEKAIEYYMKSLAIKTQVGDTRGTASTLHNMGDCYIELRDFENAQQCLIQSMKIAVEFGDRNTEAACLQNIGRLFLVKNMLLEAVEQLKRALLIYSDLKTKKEISNCHKLLADAYLHMGDYRAALAHTNKHYKLKEEVASLESAKKIENMSLLRQIESMKNESEIERLKNVELKAAYRQIEDKNRNILDSIEYAKYIQQTLLPNEESIKNSFPDSFIFFKPKDIVSGDFYWHHHTAENSLIAVADCTGHGVPGAFMSLAGNNMIEHIVKVKQIVEPAEVLYELNNAIANTFNDDDERASLKNGMDIAFCSINLVTLQLNYAGAHNSLYIVRNNELSEIDADRIAMGNKLNQQFKQHAIQLHKGDTLYLFSDGYADQKGGDDRKKFYYPPFKQLLTDISPLPMNEQREALYYTVKEWMKNETQIDDMTVVGVKIN
ncbi:MAG: tetratricopeptide repeat protein [Bacteroidia bacterium]|nr:tetratricopeptide repeat protein [Bacteroidia bacterium]